MKLKNLSISSQLFIGFGAMLAFVIIMASISNIQSDEIQQKTEDIYTHPFHVKDAVNAVKVDISMIQLATHDILLLQNKAKKQITLQQMEIAQHNAEKQFEIIKALYLGPKKDIDNAYEAYICWKIARDENTKLALAGNADAVIESVGLTGKVEKARADLLNKIQVIQDFANTNAERMYISSQDLQNTLSIQLFFLTITIIFLSTVIGFFVTKTLRNPILDLANVAKRYNDGDLTVRSTINTKNELGLLSAAFNTMIDNIQRTLELKNKLAEINEVMLSKQDSHTFFKYTITELCEHTNSQMAAVYLLSEDEKSFVHYESIGLTEKGKLSFATNNQEGEFGIVLSSHRIHSIKDIPLDTRFIFQTTSGHMVPRELITIPILSEKKVIAIISLASIRNYSVDATNLLHSIYDTMNARVEGVLAFREMRHLLQQLEEQNIELESQKNQLKEQSTELTLQNTELEMQKNQLFEASQLKTSFLSNMSHELRTPLNSVIALSGVLSRRLKSKIPADEFSYLDVIERNGKHLLSLINDILDISRIESGREEVEINQFKVDDLITDIAEMIEPQAAQKKIKLVMLPSESGITINSDMHKCRHIVQNLIGNAVKFTDKGKVEISVSQEQENITICVSDTGIGIEEKHLEHIFEEFRQADGSTSRRFGGTGLGLAIARKYAQLLGGNITVKSKIGSGSVFSLVLPKLYSQDNQITPPTAKYQKPVQLNTTTNTIAGKRILLVDDSEPAIIQLKDFMEGYGYEVIVANNAADALASIDKTIPDAIILDLMMPEMDGFELLGTIRNAEETAALPVLILTAKHITKDELAFLKRNNVHQLIQKGNVNRDELLQAVASMVNSPKTAAINPSMIKEPIVGKPIVLVIEDNEDNMTTVRALIDNNFTLLEATNAQQGIDLALQQRPHLVLMDLALPTMSGIEAFKKMRTTIELSTIPVIALTASAMTTDREVILAHGFDGYIAKPIDEKKFFDVINKVLFGK